MRTLRVALALIVLALLVPALGGDAGRLKAQVPKHNCSFCHNLHGGSQGTLSDYAVVKDLCNSCHGPSGPETAQRDGVDVTIPKAGRGADPNSYFEEHNGQKHIDNSRAATGCFDCHNHEGQAGSNLKMIRELMPTPLSGSVPVLFTAFTGSASFGDDDPITATYYDGVCQACHTVTDVHRNDALEPVKSHDIGIDCTTCHKHDTGFQGAGSCSTCHDTGGAGTTGPNNRRAIIPEFSRASHHADGVTDADCEVCHDYSTRTGSHPQGAVTLWNVDFPTNVDSAIVLSGDPQTSSTEAEKLTKFCIRCHDTDGANGTTAPFSDATDRILIDEAAWLASSHEGSADIAGCYGNGTFGCHASGHGSQKTPLLGLAPAAAPDSGSSGNTLYYAQEGFCFNCHRSGVGSAPNIEDQFNTTINWVAEGAGAQNSLLLNDRHDVQHAAQATSGAAIECVACHDPHQATADQKVKVDPDPTDGIVPAIGARMNTDNLSDYMTEWCLDCHDNSFPAGVSANTDGLTDIAALWTPVNGGDKHGGTARGNTSLDSEPISDWVAIESIVTTPGRGGKPPTVDTTYVSNIVVPCWGCHSTHPMRQDELDNLVSTQGRTQALNNLFQLKSWVTKRDGTTVIPPDADEPTFGTHSQVTNNASTAPPIERGEGQCYTCHYNQMNNTNCFRCHFHNTGNKF
jgi:hypothetical protein